MSLDIPWLKLLAAASQIWAVAARYFSRAQFRYRARAASTDFARNEASSGRDDGRVRSGRRAPYRTRMVGRGPERAARHARACRAIAPDRCRCGLRAFISRPQPGAFLTRSRALATA